MVRGGKFACQAGGSFAGARLAEGSSPAHTRVSMRHAMRARVCACAAQALLNEPTCTRAGTETARARPFAVVELHNHRTSPRREREGTRHGALLFTETFLLLV